ncbi:hypothetical protein [Erwinia amylovora]|uniref:hypothetical protein n=1 Tax=Erwinia amylovora TaxID=552 RepID=UPI001443F4A7|nr:hypothetical protein [Erwinia amylovora]
MKTKWFSANIHITYKELREALVKYQFNENLGWGFQVDKYSPACFQARYSEKFHVNEIITDPFGSESTIEYIKYNNFNFWLLPDEKGNHVLIIENPPRTIKPFIENIVKCIGGDFTVSAKQIKIEQFANFFKHEFERVEFKKAKLKGLTFGKYTSGNLDLESSSDALDDVKEFFTHASYRIDKAKILIGRDGFNNHIEITSGGTIVFDEDDFDDVVKAVKGL